MNALAIQQVTLNLLFLFCLQVDTLEGRNRGDQLGNEAGASCLYERDGL